LIIDVIVHSGYKTLLTSSMHIESITAAHRELVDRNKKLEESLEKLRELDRLKSNFLATVSHELRTPLTSVIGYSEMLLEGLVGEMTAEQKEYVATIFEKGESLLDLIGSILDISRIESGRLTLSKVDLNLSELADSAISTVKPQAQKKRLELHCEIEPEIPPVRGDRDKVRQCMVNLLANAVKFTPEGGRIDLKVEHYHGSRRAPPASRRDEAGYTLFEMMDEDFVRISVKDSGIGIADDQKERIFDSFYQVDSSSTRAYGGTGLGLSIVKSYMEAHEGEVWVDSVPGEGSTFALLLPTPRRGADAIQSAAGAR
ncbi:MAG: sensor histidine kinase, partial [Myxococcota bacterium]